MKSILLFTTSWLCRLVLIALWVGPGAQAQAANPSRYTLTDLGALGGTYSYAYGLNNAGVVAGGAATVTQTGGVYQTAFLWDDDLGMIDLGTLGGPDCPDCNSEAGGPNAYGVAPVISETSHPAYMGEDFCGFGTHRQCLAALWKNGFMTALRPLKGGHNSQAYWTNNKGQTAGLAENGILDSTCSGSVPFQVLRFEAVIWQPNGAIRELHPLQGDTVGFAFGMNEKGQVVGTSGLCSNTSIPPNVHGPHAVLWEADGSPLDLGSLGGTLPNVADAINDRGEVVGASQFTDGTIHPFRWTKRTGMQDLGIFPGAVVTLPPCCHTINNKGEVVGFSIDGTTGNMRAVLWQNSGPIDLNTLIPAGSPWYLQAASSINDAGQIVGWGTINGNTHAFLAIPCDRDEAHSATGDISAGQDTINDAAGFATQENLRQLLQLRFGRLGALTAQQ
jgi:probable HAF family extracellular repeat protein